MPKPDQYEDAPDGYVRVIEDIETGDVFYLRPEAILGIRGPSQTKNFTLIYASFLQKPLISNQPIEEVLARLGELRAH